MINSIQYFQEKGVKRLTEIFSKYTDDLTKFAEMVQGVTKEVTRLGLSIIEEELESYDQLLRERQDLRKGWYIDAAMRQNCSQVWERFSITRPIFITGKQENTVTFWISSWD